MGAVYFYHLTRNPIDVTLPMLLGKAAQAGWRVLVRGSNQTALEQLDKTLWAGPADSFLAHGMAGGAHDGDQRILLSTAMDTPNAAQCIMAVHGADLTVEEIAAKDRCCILFDGNDGDALARARTQWKELTDAGAAAQYWSEEGGRWEKKAEKNTPE
jgi:DNA polymerase-3 subunit chi